ncbi:hypothetical protein ACIQZG_23750 [Lysinibacillus sp. NPDC096418]|uniref:hypothetical protein n=1 Tax=Lysinibacillus sp. NPDC096418 TaxID=3364138 RepID=UPI003830EB95
MGYVLVLLGFLGVFVGLALLIIGLIKKKKMKGGLVLGISAAAFIVGFIMVPTNSTDSTNDSNEKEKVATVAKPKEETAEEKAAREAKETEEKALAEQKANEEAKLKEEQTNKEKEVKMSKQKDYYIKSTQPAIDEWVKTYDQLWNSIWKPTFEAIGNGSRDVYAAYDNMKSLKDGYRTLTLKDSVPVEGLSKEQQKTIKEAMRDLTYAAASRQLAAEKAMKMFDTSDFSPSQMDKIKSDVATSDTQLMKGVIGITKVKQELGLIEEANN